MKTASTPFPVFSFVAHRPGRQLVVPVETLEHLGDSLYCKLVAVTLGPSDNGDSKQVANLSEKAINKEGG